jgi:ABC-type branched-subunit amino acid transport system substrate-binding protein
MLLVSYGSTAPSLSIPGDNIFRFVPDETRQSPAIARYLAEAGITNLVPIWRGDAWGDGLIDAVRSEFTKIGGVMDEGVRYHPETIEFSSEVSLLADIVGNHVAEVGEDRVAVVVVTFTEITPITQSASPYESLSQVLWFSTDTVVNDAELASDAIAQEFLNRAGLVITAFAPASNPVSERVSEQAAEISGKAPNIYALSAYDVIWGLGLSILEADSTETEAIISVMPTVLEDYPGALGSIVLNDAGDMAEATYDIYSVREPVWTLIGSYDSASDLLVFVEGAELGGPAAGDEAPDAAASDDVDEGGCLIATAAYGSELAPQVQFLRELRDNSLLSTASGTSFMTGFNQFYYSFSPAVADLERENAAFRDAVRTAISPGIYALNIMTLADPGSEFSVVAFGLLSIAAVAGIYVVAPSLAVHAVARRIRSRQARPI